MTLDELVERGRVAYFRWAHEQRRAKQLGTESFFVVTRADFLLYTAVCLTALKLRSSLYILGEDGAIDALLCRHRLP